MIKHFLLSLCSVKQDVELLLQPTTFHINILPVLTNNKIPGSGTVTPQEGTKKKKTLCLLIGNTIWQNAAVKRM